MSLISFYPQILYIVILQRISNFSLASKNYQFPQSFHTFDRQKKNKLFVYFCNVRFKASLKYCEDRKISLLLWDFTEIAFNRRSKPRYADIVVFDSAHL